MQKHILWKKGKYDGNDGEFQQIIKEKRKRGTKDKKNRNYWQLIRAQRIKERRYMTKI